MQRIFIETNEFRARWAELGYTLDELWEFQDFLMQNPAIGDMISGAGGLRKIRWKSAGGGGKSGGSRVLYVDFANDAEIWLISVFAKRERVNITEAEKKAFKTLIQAIKGE